MQMDSSLEFLWGRGGERRGRFERLFEPQEMKFRSAEANFPKGGRGEGGACLDSFLRLKVKGQEEKEHVLLCANNRQGFLYYWQFGILDDSIKQQKKSWAESNRCKNCTMLLPEQKFVESNIFFLSLSSETKSEQKKKSSFPSFSPRGFFSIFLECCNRLR